MNRVPSNLPPKGSGEGQKIESRGDVSREMLAASDITRTMIFKRSLKQANERNGISRMITLPKRDPFKDYFGNTNAKRLPSAGKPNLATRSAFDKAQRTGGHIHIPHKTNDSRGRGA